MTKSSVMEEQQEPDQENIYESQYHGHDQLFSKYHDDEEPDPIFDPRLRLHRPTLHCTSNNTNTECQCRVSASETREFRKKWVLLTDQERITSLHASFEQFSQTAMDVLSCAGCRTSTETMLLRIADGIINPAFVCSSGLCINSDASITLKERHLNNPEEALRLFCHQERWGNSTAAKLGRGGKSSSRSRCSLHSQRPRSGPRPAAFESLWNNLPDEHRHYLSQIDADQFLNDLESYLRRHRFCCRCKEKVLEAYDLVVGASCSEDDCEECSSFGCMDKVHEYSEDLHYTSFLFDEVGYCRSTGHIVVPCHIDFMSQLMARADQEVLGDWGDRHARTIAEAQDEVLTCLGLVIWEKMQNLWSSSRVEKRSEELVLYLAITCIRRNFDIAVEALHGQEMMDQLLAEEDDESRRLARKKEKRKEKKKKRKHAKAKNASIHGCCVGCNNKSSNSGDVPVLPDPLDVDLSNSKDEDDRYHALQQEKSFKGCAMSETKTIDEDAEMQLLSAMGWCEIRDDGPEIESGDEIPADEIIYWKENQSKLVSRRLEQRQRLQAQFKDFVLRSNN